MKEEMTSTLAESTDNQKKPYLDANKEKECVEGITLDFNIISGFLKGAESEEKKYIMNFIKWLKDDSETYDHFVNNASIVELNAVVESIIEIGKSNKIKKL